MEKNVNPGGGTKERLSVIQKILSKEQWKMTKRHMITLIVMLAQKTWVGADEAEFNTGNIPTGH